MANVNHIPFHHADHYHGYVSPMYVRNSFEFRYWGPAGFVGVTYYPRWYPWVDWSWHITAIRCGTRGRSGAGRWCTTRARRGPITRCRCGRRCRRWPAARGSMSAGGGRRPSNTTCKCWPCGSSTRATRRRSSARDTGVVPQQQRPCRSLSRSTWSCSPANGQLTPGLPQAGVRVTSIEAGDTQSVDSGCRSTVTRWAATSKAAGPFSTVHVLVDANREIPQRAGSKRADRRPADILPVDPAAFELDPANGGGRRRGARWRAKVSDREPGQVLVHIGGREWRPRSSAGTTWACGCRCPSCPGRPTAADLIVVRGDGAAANPLR